MIICVWDKEAVEEYRKGGRTKKTIVNSKPAAMRTDNKNNQPAQRRKGWNEGMCNGWSKVSDKGPL